MRRARAALAVLAATLWAGCDPISHVKGVLRLTAGQAQLAQGKKVTIDAVRAPRPRPGCPPDSDELPWTTAVKGVEGPETPFVFSDFGVHTWQFVATIEGVGLTCLSAPVTPKGGTVAVELTCVPRVPCAGDRSGK